MVAANGARCPAGFHIAGQQFQDLTKGEVGIAHTGVGITVAAGDDQISMGFLSTLAEFVQQCCFPAACFASDEYHPALAGQGQVEKVVQSL